MAVEAGEVKSVVVDAVGGAAEVYGPQGFVGRTPLAVRGRVGEKFSFVLRRAGAEDLAVEFQVSERGVYSYTMRGK